MTSTYHLDGTLGNIRPGPSFAGHHGFWLSNPEPRPVEVRLHFTSMLPPGWRWSHGPRIDEPVWIPPFEAVWVELVISPTPAVHVPYRYSVAGTVDGWLIGAMTGHVPASPGWRDGERTGVLDLKIRTGRTVNCLTGVSGEACLSLP